MYIIKIIIILIKTQGCHYDFKLLGVSKLDFRQRIKELYVGSYFAFVFLTLFLMKVLVVGGGVMLIVARENPYPLALSDSPEVYTGLKGELAR